MLVDNEKISFLQSVNIFKNTPRKVLEDISPELMMQSYKAGEDIFIVGETGDYMYIVQDGNVHIHEGKRVITNLGPREIFGEVSLLEAAPREVSATANEDSIVVCIHHDMLLHLMNTRSEVAQGIIKVLTKHLQELDRDLDNLRHLLEEVILPLGVALSTEKSIFQLLERILIEAKNLCNADAGTIYLRSNNDALMFTIMFTDSLSIAMGGSTGKEITYPPLQLFDKETGVENHKNVATHVALTGSSINIPDVYFSDQFDFSGTKKFDNSTGYRSKACLTVPLKDHNSKVIGVLQLFNPYDSASERVIPFNDYQQLIVESLTSQAAVALNTQMLLRRQEGLLKLEHDLQVGRQIQADFLPDSIPQPAGWEIDARFQPAREVAGDFYDAFMVAGNKVGFVVADVCDKGVGAALFMALSRSLIRAFSWLNTIDDSSLPPWYPAASKDASPIELTNNYIGNFHLKMNMFVTLFYGILDPETGVISYVNGGHNPPIIVSREGKIKARLNPTGPAVGIMPEFKFEMKEITLTPGEMLYVFTDGVPDARDSKGNFFTEEHLIELLSQKNTSATAVVDLIEESLQNHVAEAAPFDDVTMMAIRCAE